jgi:putative addiction module component (TIGR02574 family)
MKDLDRILKLPLEERIELVEAIWESIEKETSVSYEVDEETKALLEEGLAEYKASPDSGRDWDVVKKEIEDGL